MRLAAANDWCGRGTTWPGWAARNTTLTRRWRRSQRTTWRPHSMHWRGRSGPGSAGWARVNGQPAREIDTARQCRAWTTSSNAGRQTEAWLSPIRPTVCRAWDWAAPHQHARIRCSWMVRLHGDREMIDGATRGAG